MILVTLIYKIHTAVRVSLTDKLNGLTNRIIIYEARTSQVYVRIGGNVIVHIITDAISRNVRIS